MKIPFKQFFNNPSKVSVLVFACIFVSIVANLNAQTIGNGNKPINVTLSVANFDQSLKTYELITSIYANSKITDFKVEIQSASFIELIGSQNRIEPELTSGQNIQLKSTYNIKKNSSFKIKAVFSGIQLPDSTKFLQVEYYYFLYKGRKFEVFSDPSPYKALKSVSIENDLRVFNRVEVEHINTGVVHRPILKSAPYSLSVSGLIGYRDKNDVWHPVRYAKVEVFDKDLLFSTSLGITATDANGNYSIDITSSESDGPDIYIECSTVGIDNFPSGSSGIAEVKDDILSFTYVSETKGYVLENSTTNVNISFTIANTGSNAGCFDVYDSFVEGWLKAKQYFNINIEKVTVLWPEGNDNNAYFDGDWWYIGLDAIAIGQLMRYDRDVHLHEYGHYIDEKYQLTNKLGGRHGWENLTGISAGVTRTRNQAVRTAMGEGWATFFSVSTQFTTTNNDTQFDAFSEFPTTSYHLPLENVPSPEYPLVKDADHEGAVSGILWDIFDAANEPHDNLSEGLAEVWRVLTYGGKIDSIQQFATRWQALGKDNLNALLKIYSHFGIYPDLIPINQSLSTTSVQAGSTLTAYCSERNSGSVPVGANVVSVHLSADEIFDPTSNGVIYLGEISIPGVAANSCSISYSKSLTIPSNVSPGNYYVFFSADGGQAIDEADEYNNFASVILTINATVFTHDYSVKSISVSNKNPTVGEVVSVSAVIRNEGTAAEADNQVVKLYDNGVLIDTYSSFSSLIAGGERTQTFNWTAKAGAHELKVEVALTGDENSANNSKTIKTYTGSSGNLLINGEGIQEIEVTSYSGSTNLFSLQLQNTSADNISASISTTGAKESWITLLGGNSISIPSGQSKNYNIRITVPAGTSSGTNSAGIEFTYAEGTKTSAINFTVGVIESATGLFAYEYWFDDQYGTKKYCIINSGNILELNTSLSTSGISDGLHVLHLRILDNNGYWSSVISEVFHKQPISPNGVKKVKEFEYWFDDGYSSKALVSVAPEKTLTLNENIDAVLLPVGLHSYHMRFKDDGGQWSSVISDVFHKLPASPDGVRKIKEYEYWYDDQYSSKALLSVASEQTYTLNGNIDAASLPVGLHSYHMRYKDDGGQWSSVISDVFHKLPVNASQTNLISTYRYWFNANNQEMSTVALPEPVNPYQLIRDIDIAGFAEGNHTVHFQFRDNNHSWSSVVTDTVTKIPVLPSIKTVMTVFLEGPYNTGAGLMNKTLNNNSVIPLAQPFNTAPWNYSGLESLSAVPADAVDWVLLELRQAASPDLATSSTILAKRAAILKSNGAVVDLDGTSPVVFENSSVTEGNNLYIVVRHRNHLAIMSATGAILNSGVYSYDFTSGLGQAYGGGSGYKQAGSTFAMVSGDVDNDGNIFVSDFNNWAVGFGATNGYLNADFDMDGNAFVSDYNKWAVNFGSQADSRLKSAQINAEQQKPKYKSWVPE